MPGSTSSDNSLSSLANATPNLRNLEWMLNHSNLPSWNPDPLCLCNDLGNTQQYYLCHPTQPLYHHPHRRAYPTPFTSPESARVPLRTIGKWCKRDQHKHPLSYNPICWCRPYSLGPHQHIPNAITAIPAIPAKATTDSPNINLDTTYPSQLICHPTIPFNTDQNLCPPSYSVLQYLAGIAITLPSRYHLLTLQQALWIEDYITNKVWPAASWTGCLELVNEATTIEACYWIEDLFSPYAHRELPLTARG
jgi:hypothetical protein